MLTSEEAIISIRAALACYDRARSDDYLQFNLAPIREGGTNEVFQRHQNNLAKITAEFPENIRQILKQLPKYDPAS